MEEEKKEVDIKVLESSKEKVKNKKEQEIYLEPPKTLEEAKARVGGEIELNEYGLVKEPTSHVEEWAVGCMGLFAIAGAIILNILFYGKALGFIIDIVIFGVAGLVGGGIVGYIIGSILGSIFVSKEQKQKDEEAKKKCEELNKKYNLQKIEKTETNSNINIKICCPECCGKVETINKETRIGDIGIGDEDAVRHKTTYKCKECGFVYYSIEATTKKHKDRINQFTDLPEKHILRTDSLVYRTDEKCSEKALRILNKSGYKTTTDEFEEQKAAVKETRKKIKSGEDW